MICGGVTQKIFKRARTPQLTTAALNCHLSPAPTSGDLLEELLPGDDPAQPVAGAPAVMVHSQVDILSLWGHAPKTLAARGLRELPKHH